MNLDSVNLDSVRRIADAVLYEGYVLYPYRASAQKNRSRWQFGVLMPPGYAAVDPSETTVAQAECVFEHSGQPAIEVMVRFLQVQRRTGTSVWDEAVSREIHVRAGDPTRFTVPGGADHSDGVVRRREPLAGSVSVRTRSLPGPWQAAKLTIEVRNETTTSQPPSTRDQALPSALVAVHMIIAVSGGEFISMTDPPEWASAAVGDCENVGCWPVLAGPDGGREIMLASPIILPDHPELAQESPGELYDGTEIDEILTLRTLALSDAEKAEARATDPRAAALIDRVESMDAATMERLHGAIRVLRPAAGGPGQFDTVIVGGQRIARGSRVTLRPGIRRADAQDMFLAGRPAIVEAVLRDVDDVTYLAVSLADDPAADLRSAHGRFLYFTPDEVEP
ncbi:MAG TPA: hypothetical protein VF070_35335 [Streptosporangiaceae bacterium]